MLTEFLLATLLLIVFWLFNLNRRPKKFPPGPFSWPLVGNLFQIGHEPYKSFLKMRDTYGDLLGLYFGTTRLVVINDAKLMKEAFSLNAMSGRTPLKHMLHPQSGKKRGLIFGDGTEWSEQRRFVIKNLRDFGFGRKSMEALIQDEVDELIEGLRKNVGQPIHTHVRFNVAIINALWTIVSGERFSHDDQQIQKLIDLLSANMTTTKVMKRGLPFQWLSDIAPEFSGHNEYVANVRPILSFFQDSIDSHKKTYDEGTTRDLIDCFIQEMNKAPKTSSFNGKTGEENMLISVYDLFLAGGETTSTTLSWACFLLAHFPNCQEKLNKVITEVVGISRRPCLADRPNMAYVEALMMEVLRYSSMMPVGVMHQTMEDVDFHGYKIPKGTMIIPNNFGIMHDPKVWKDPENFRPERFLSPDEKTVLRHEALVAFSVGKRACLGESLARDQLFLFLTGLFQRLSIQFDPNAPTPKLGHPSNFAPILTPAPHKIVFSDRCD